MEGNNPIVTAPDATEVGSPTDDNSIVSKVMTCAETNVNPPKFGCKKTTSQPADSQLEWTASLQCSLTGQYEISSSFCIL